MMSFPIPSPEGLRNALGLAEPPVHIGTGGFKVVYRMETPAGPEAIKAVYVPPAGNENEDAARAQLIARAEREIEALGKSTNPALVKLGSLPPQLHTVDGHDYLIYGEEYLPGESLDGWIVRDPRPSFEEILSVFRSFYSAHGNGPTCAHRNGPTC